MSKLNCKEFNTPSFFTISNLGGGGSDKYRETVYQPLLHNTPTLYNYYYLNKGLFSSDGLFAQKWLRKINSYNSFSDFNEYVRKDMTNNSKFIYENASLNKIDLGKTVYLLDSGAANIINDITNSFSLSDDEFIDKLIQIMKDYYNFANKYKFDLVIGFDIGGKYTFKGKERNNERIIAKNQKIRESSDLNKLILEETIKFLKGMSFYPKVYATVHGNTIEEYELYAKYILELEDKYDYKFYGFALGGIASAKSNHLNLEKWNITDAVLENIKKVSKGFNILEIKNTLLSTKAAYIVKKTIGPNRKIHALGAGGKLNIIPLYLSGCTSFDTQTPGRRAYDGNKKSVDNIFKNTKVTGAEYPKYLVPFIDKSLTFINIEENFKYKPLYSVDDTIKLCDCIVCKNYTIKDLKELYSKKDLDPEAYYFAKQLINTHAIYQHKFLCKLLELYGKDVVNHLPKSSFKNIIEFIENWKVLE